ncbi:MAG: segregation/condensation protein A [Anaerolineae bacterium]|nr:segregation/condensation protein A [Anaerolineae bacterium]
MTYRVQLEVFEGPLDLLLTLIEREELDITVVSLAKVTGQYLEYIQRLERVHPQMLAEFLVVAAKLLYIKSLALLPRPESPEEEEEEEDVGQELVQQLQEYRRYRDIARLLQERLEAGMRAYVRIAPPPTLESTSFRLEGVTLEDLLQAAQEAFAVAPPAPDVSEVVSPLVVTVEDQMALIRSRLRQSPRVAFRSLLRHSRNRTDVIVTLLAILEMARRFEVALHQDEPFGEIWIEAPSAPAHPPGEPPMGAAASEASSTPA